MRDGPCDPCRHVLPQTIGYQYRGTGDVRIDVERHTLIHGTALDRRQGFDGSAEILRHRAFVVTDHDRNIDRPADLQRFLDRQQNVVGFVAHMSDIDATGRAQSLGDRDHLIGGASCMLGG